MLNEKQLLDNKKELAKLVVYLGLNFKKGKHIFIHSYVEHADLARLIVEECYKAGARRVDVIWEDMKINHLNNIYGDEKDFSNVKSYEIEKAKYYTSDHSGMMYMLSEDFTNNKKEDKNKVLRIINARQKELIKYSDRKQSNSPWTVIPVPTISWAMKLFPKDKEEIAYNKLWELLFKVLRVEKNKTISNWNKHIGNLNKRMNYLNSLNIKELHYKASNGTDIKVGLIPNTKFLAAEAYDNFDKRNYNCNLPTEEVFISPDRNVTEGIVYSSRPLAFEGHLIEDFSIKFHKGKIVEVHAKKNEDLLKKLISIDKNGCYLGECALVPFDSIISQTNKLFYTTLIDENASCHFAFGMAFPFVVPNFQKYKLDELEKMGLNVKANVHIDFMIGTKDLDIVATTFDNKKVKIFNKGSWAK